MKAYDELFFFMINQNIFIFGGIISVFGMKVKLRRSITFSLKKTTKSCVTTYPEPKSFSRVIEALFIFSDESVCEYLHKHMHTEVCIVNIPTYQKRNSLPFKPYYIVLYDLFVHLSLICQNYYNHGRIHGMKVKKKMKNRVKMTSQ